MEREKNEKECNNADRREKRGELECEVMEGKRKKLESGKRENRIEVGESKVKGHKNMLC